MKEQQIVLITGCSSGIGLHLTQVLQTNPCYKIYATSRNITPLKDNVDSSTVTVRKLDVSSQDDICNVVGAILDKEGRLDILVHCAAISNCQPVENVSMETVQDIMNTNVIGLQNLTNTVLPSMKERKRGCIIAISAVCGNIGFPFNSIYSSSKFAVEGFCEALREELAHENILVNLIQPGPVLTNFNVKSIQQNTSDNNKVDVTTSQLYETYTQKNTASYQTMGQSVEDVCKIIMQCIYKPAKQPLRITTNTVYSNNLSRVYKQER